MKNSNIKAMHLLCGGGLSAYGYKTAGFTSVLGNDNDPSVLKTYSNNISKDILCEDFTKVDWKAVKEKLEKENNLPTVLESGLVCKTFSGSFNGERWNDKRTNYIFKMIDIIKLFNFQVVQFEQSSRITSFPLTPKAKKGSFLKKVLKTFKEELPEYKITTKTINAREYGLSQTRERWICILSRIGKINIPQGIPFRDIMQKELTKADFKDNLFLDWEKIEKIEEERKKKSAGGSWIRNHTPDSCGHTITANPWNISRDKAVVVFPEQKIARNYTRQEMRKIQGIPSDFNLEGLCKTNFGKVVGNGFSPKISHEIALSIKKKIYEQNKKETFKES